MTFLNPWLLLGGAAVGVPIVVHFFFKARYKPLPWAAMKFLREAIEQTSQRIKFQEWILLLLRCLVILLLALALARLARSTAGTAGRGDSIDAVLVIDNSFSMGAQDGDKTRLDRAKEAALQVIDGLPANSTVQVYTCAGIDAEKPVFLGPVSRTNLDQARELIKSVRVSGLGTKILPGLTEALTAAETGSAPVKEIYLFTDMQKLGFEQDTENLKQKCQELTSKANLVIVRCGNPERRVVNVAVTDVQPEGLLPRTNTRTPFVVTLKNRTTEPVKGVSVGLELDGKSITAEALTVDEIEPKGEKKVTLTGELGSLPGTRLLTVRIKGDALPGDNRFDRLITVGDRIRVLIVDGDLNWEAIESLDAKYGVDFVEAGLDPKQPRTRVKRKSPRDPTAKAGFIQTEVRTPREVSPADLNGKDLVVLCNVPVPVPGRPTGGVGQDFIDRLAEYVKGGGGLLIGVGPNAELADVTDRLDQPGKKLIPHYNRVLGSGGANLLPFDLTTDVSGIGAAATDADPFHPGAVEPGSYLAPFVESGGRFEVLKDLIPRVRVRRMVRMETPPTGSPDWAGRAVVVKANERPFIASRTVGDGQVILLATTLDERWTDFPGVRSDTFAPFLQLTLRHLTSRKVVGGNQTAGEPITWYPKEAGGNFDLLQPIRDGETSPRRVRLGAGQAPNPGDRLSVTATGKDTSDSGVYRITRENVAPTPDDPTFAANPDLRESANLDMATPADLNHWLGFEPTIIQAGAGTEAAVAQTRAQREYTEWLLLGLLVLLLCESAWAWFCGRAW